MLSTVLTMEGVLDNPSHACIKVDCASLLVSREAGALGEHPVPGRPAGRFTGISLERWSFVFSAAREALVELIARHDKTKGRSNLGLFLVFLGHRWSLLAPTSFPIKCTLCKKGVQRGSSKKLSLKGAVAMASKVVIQHLCAYESVYEHQRSLPPMLVAF